MYFGTLRFTHPTKITTDNMAKYSKKHLLSEKSKVDAMKIARGTQKPGQTKEQTKLIAHGIQKGIEIYKKKQSAKARELDKKLNKVSALRASHETSTEQMVEPVVVKGNKLPWVLLVLSWLGFVVYAVLIK
jgi:pyridoxine/pyridoxamine 5'-phosphate oxidase